MDETKRAAIGDKSGHQILLSSGVKSLQSRAAKIPEITRRMNAKSSLRAAKRRGERDSAFSTLDMMRNASDLNFSDYWEAASFFKSQHLNPMMPVVPIVRFNKALYELWRWVKGRAWIAGSAALWCADPDADWMYGDIDVFCKSVEFYEMLKSELKEIRYPCSITADETGEYNCKFTHHPFTHAMPMRPWGVRVQDPSISLISPVGKDWSTIENVLLGFDLSICAVAIANPNKAYAYSPYDIGMGQTDVICVEYPTRTLKRLFKYMRRGYRASYGLTETVAGDSRFDAIFEILELASEYTEHHELRSLIQKYRESESWLEAYGDGDHEEDDDEDDGYHFS